MSAEDSYDSAEDSDYVPELNADDNDEDRTGASCGSVADHRNSRKTDVSSSNANARKRKRAHPVSTAGRRGGIMLEDEATTIHTTEANAPLSSSAVDHASIAAAKEEEERQRKKELDDLFLKELGGAAPKPVSRPALASSSKPGTSKVLEFRLPGSSTLKPSHSTATKPVHETVAIQKTFDFAGETVTVTQVVGKDSREAKKFEDRQRTVQNRSEALDAILGLMDKKKSMATVTKSSLDWEAFKKQEGLEEELSQHRKNGFLEKKDFLDATKWKEYELELQQRQEAK